jgi:hypothetical protein
MYVYTLLCPDESKYFIGSSARILADPLVHFKNENKGYTYLEDYPMTEVVSREKVDGEDGLESKVLDTMKEHGAYNVRGGSFMVLSKENIKRIIDMNLVKRRSCILCASKSHSSVKCTEYNTDDDSDYVPSEHESGSEEDSESYIEDEGVEEDEEKDMER